MALKQYNINKPDFVNSADSKGIKPVTPSQRPFTRRNFIFMAICVLLIIVGFLLMSGGGSTDGSFNPDIFSTRRIVVGPLSAFAGFLLMAFAIIYTPKDKKETIDSNDNMEATALPDNKETSEKS